jgi:hypothetical protein
MKVVMARRLAENMAGYLRASSIIPTVLRAAVICRGVNSTRLDPLVKPFIELFIVSFERYDFHTSYVIDKT